MSALFERLLSVTDLTNVTIRCLVVNDPIN